MKKINLAAIARKVEETYEDVETSFGTVRVYHVPDAVVWSFKPDWEPEPLPMVEMNLAGNNKQRRPAKAGDSGFAEYEADVKRHEDEAGEIQFSARFVLALRDVEYPADLSRPPENYAGFINGSYPPESPGDVRRKHFWLKLTLMARRVDETEIRNAMIRLNTGVDSGLVDNVKKSSASITEDTTATDPAAAEG